MDLGLVGRWALVGGASRGLGFGCAQALVREGVHVLMVARRPDVLAAAAKELIAGDAARTGAQVLHCAADITTALMNAVLRLTVAGVILVPRRVLD